MGTTLKMVDIDRFLGHRLKDVGSRNQGGIHKSFEIQQRLHVNCRINGSILPSAGELRD